MRTLFVTLFLPGVQAAGNPQPGTEGNVLQTLLGFSRRLVQLSLWIIGRVLESGKSLLYMAGDIDITELAFWLLLGGLAAAIWVVQRLA